MPASFQLFARPGHPTFLDLPWDEPLEDWQSERIVQVAARVLKQPITVENKAGAAGMIGAKAIAAAKPDGYTVGQIPISVTRFSQLGTLQADPRKDFTYLARTSGQTFGIAVLPNSKFQTLKDMVAYAKDTAAGRRSIWDGGTTIRRGPHHDLLEARGRPSIRDGEATPHREERGGEVFDGGHGRQQRCLGVVETPLW